MAAATKSRMAGLPSRDTTLRGATQLDTVTAVPYAAFRSLSGDICMTRVSVFRAALTFLALGLASAAHAQGSPQTTARATLFQNVRIFDGKGGSLSAPSNVLVKGNIIERISATPIAAEPGVTVIAGNGRTLMPGLIDAHWHAMLIRPDPVQAITGDAGYNNIAAGVEATDT